MCNDARQQQQASSNYQKIKIKETQPFSAGLAAAALFLMLAPEPEEDPFSISFFFFFFFFSFKETRRRRSSCVCVCVCFQFQTILHTEKTWRRSFLFRLPMIFFSFSLFSLLSSLCGMKNKTKNKIPSVSHGNVVVCVCALPLLFYVVCLF